MSAPRLAQDDERCGRCGTTECPYTTRVDALDLAMRPEIAMLADIACTLRMIARRLPAATCECEPENDLHRPGCAQSNARTEPR